jgi:hypothetical protein
VETVAREIARLAKPLQFAARVLEVAAIVYTIIGVMIGIGLIGETEKALGDTLDPRTTHPWVGAGIGVVIGAILLGTFMWCIARALRIFAIESAAKHGESIVVEPRPTRLRGDVSPRPTGSVRRAVLVSLGCFVGFVLLLIAWSSR